MEYEPTNFNKKIYSLIKDIEVQGVVLKKFHQGSNAIKQLPCLVYFITNEDVDYCFKGVSRENATFQIDVYSENKSEISKIVAEVKKVMFKNNVKYIRGLELGSNENIGRYVLQFKIQN